MLNKKEFRFQEGCGIFIMAKFLEGKRVMNKKLN